MIDAGTFWEGVDRSADCWQWKRGDNGANGYGKVYIRWDAEADRSIYAYAHRVAWELTFGPIPDGLQVLHQCDNPPCVRPAHLFLGTRPDNMADAGRKGHLARDVRGTRNPGHRLEPSDVVAIREAHRRGASMTDLGRAYGVSRHTVSLAVRRRTWKDVAA